MIRVLQFMKNQKKTELILHQFVDLSCLYFLTATYF